MKKIYSQKDINKSELAEKRVPKKRSYKLPVILVVVWIVIIALFGYSIWISKEDNVDETGQATSIGAGGNANTTSISQPEVIMSDEEREQARIRDSKRLADVKQLRAKLEIYQEDNGYYPENLDSLVPDYLEYLPQNPTPGGTAYNYTGIGSSPYQYYDMTYTLEVGVEEIDPGMHVANPGGIAVP